MKAFRLLICLAAIMTIGSCGGTDDRGGDGGGSQTPVEVKPEAGKDLYGQITDEKGKGIRGVVVSDGKSSVTTNAYGIYQIKRAADAKFVYYSTPWDCEIETEEGGSAAKFYAEIPKNAGVHRQDFKLKKRSGIMTEFTVIGVGDPQVRIQRDYDRFCAETMPKLNGTIAELTNPAVMLVLGDIVEDTESWMEPMKGQLGSVDIPVFTAIGNHDFLKWEDTSLPRNSNAHCALWGPTDYSFNMGNVLFICMKNIIFSNGSKYDEGFTDEQIAWLTEHVKTASDQKTVVLFCHSPIANTGGSGTRVMNILSRFKEVHVMSGHTHKQENHENASPAYFDHIHATACGAWWWSNLAPDGSPTGFSVYNIQGGDFKNWYFQPTKGDRDFQMRIYRGDMTWTGPGEPGSFTFGLGDNVIAANVFNADSRWSIDVYENGAATPTGKMVRMTENPKDMWAMAIHEGNTWDGNRYIPVTTACKHIYKYTLEDKNATLRIVAKDRFGTTYTFTDADIVTTNLSGEITSPRP